MRNATHRGTPAAGEMRAAWLLPPPALRRQALDFYKSARDVVASIDDTVEFDVDSLRRASVLFAEAAKAAEALALAEGIAEADQSPVLPVRRLGSPPSEWLRTLRLGLVFTVNDMAAVTGVGQGTIRDVEVPRKSHRARAAKVIAEGVALAYSGQVDAAELEAELVAEWDGLGLLAPPGEWPAEPWINQRRRNRRSGHEFYRERQMRTALEEYYSDVRHSGDFGETAG